MNGSKRAAEFIVEQILPEVRRGRMVILVDDEDRENEGDLFVAADEEVEEWEEVAEHEGALRARLDLVGANRGAHARVRAAAHCRRYR